MAIKTWYTITDTDLRGRSETKIRSGAVARDALIVVLLLTAAGMVGCPTYTVWQSEKAGEATFARAEKDRQVKVLEAQAKLDSAQLEAKAEIERAKGVAGANAIIADGLKGNDAYLRYLWIDKVAGNTSREVVYVPTEANLPILEAGKRGGETESKP